MGELWKAIATGGVTLLVGVVLLQLQLGGRRRRMRHEISEELKLLDQLDVEEHSIAHERLSARVAVLLREYEPDPAKKTSWMWSPMIPRAMVFVAATGLGINAMSWVSATSVWAYLGVGVASGLVVAVLIEMLQARLRRGWFQERLVWELERRASRKRRQGSE